LAVLGVLLLGACAQEQPRTSANRVFFVDTQGGAQVCTVPKDVALAADRVTEVSMTVGNDGGWCGISVAQGGKPYAAGGVTARPQHGRVHVRNVGDVSRVDYYPDGGFAGTDSFIVAMIPGGHRMRVAVTVQPGPASTVAAPAAATPASTAPAAPTGRTRPQPRRG
jgi:hypothetical protein